MTNKPFLIVVSQQERGDRRTDISKRPVNTKPTKTLFVINFDPVHTRTRDLERHFDLHGKILNIRIRRNFAFIQFESEEEATRALEATNMRFVPVMISVLLVIYLKASLSVRLILQIPFMKS